jgi:DNA polymerase-3 subunit beta
MKILCDLQRLQEAFAVVAPIPPQKTPRPILKHVLLKAEADTVSLFATDLEISATVQLESVKVDKPGMALVPVKETNALLRELSDPTVSIQTEEFRTTLESGGGSFVLLGDDPEQFPSAPEFAEVDKIVVPASRFAEMVRQCGFAAAREESRYAINGVMLDAGNSCLRLVATDGRRLSLVYENMPAEVPERKVVLPLRALQALSRAMGEHSDQELQIIFSEQQIGFSLGNVMLVSRLLESRFPEYEGVIPKAADTTVEIDRVLLESNVRKVAVLTSGDVRVVRFSFSNSSLELSAENSDIGRGKVTMEVDVKGAGGSISFNPDFLLDALRVSDLEVVRLDMSDEATPAKFALGEAFTYVLMPISGS